MISVVIPTRNAEAGLALTLAALVPAVVDGIVREVIVVDSGSQDRTLAIVEEAGATLLEVADGGRGAQLRLGAEYARQPWLLFLHADTVLEHDWVREAAGFIERVESGRYPPSAAAFRFSLDDQGVCPRALEHLVGLRCALFRLPYGDQGLLLSRALYREIGGFMPIPLMEDVAIVRALGRARVRMLKSKAVTSAVRYQSDGYLRRSMRNVVCLISYFAGVSPRLIKRMYG